MKIIKAKTGEAIIVDDEDYEMLVQYKWSVTRSSYSNVYAQASLRGQSTSIFMHRLLMNPPSSDILVDHINGCGLDNRRDNLRLATFKENANNTDSARRRPGWHYPTTPFVGVSKCKSNGLFRAYINKSGKQIWIGSYATAEEAAVARDRVAWTKYQTRARLNFPDLILLEATPGDIAREKRAMRQGRLASAYRGVHKKPQGRGYVAKIRHANIYYYLGTFSTEKKAALVYDSVALHFGQVRDYLNFPDESIQPRSPEGIRASWPTRSRAGYLGVFKKYNKFLARIVREGQLYRIGSFGTAEEAARAYDAKAIELGDTLNLNFPIVKVAASASQ